MCIHESWIGLQPEENENLGNSSSYYERILKLNYDIPKEVIHQWIFPHFNEPNSKKNYSWINLNDMKFTLEERPTEFFENLTVIKDNLEMVNEYPMNKFAVWHRSFWKKNGTWEIPPIVIDVNSFINGKPETAEITGTYQLVEGHNRLGTLKLVIRDGRIPVAKSHKVWLMTKK